MAAPSKALTAGTNSCRNPAALARAAMGSTPRTPRTSPDRESSPRKTLPLSSQESCPEAMSRERNSGRS